MLFENITFGVVNIGFHRTPDKVIDDLYLDIPGSFSLSMKLFKIIFRILKMHCHSLYVSPIVYMNVPL